LWLRRRRRFDGQIIYSYLMIYGVARFVIEFWRDDPRGQLFGLSTSQFISVFMFALGLALSLYNWRRRSEQAVSRGQDAAAHAS